MEADGGPRLRAAGLPGYGAAAKPSAAMFDFKPLICGDIIQLQLSLLAKPGKVKRS